MDKIEIYGGHQLKGTVSIAGAKNAALPLMCTSLLTDQCIILKNVPSSLSDIVSMAKLLKQTGVEIQLSKKEQSVCLQARQVVNCVADYDLVSKMRASILVFGPLLARVGRAYGFPSTGLYKLLVTIALHALKGYGTHLQGRNFMLAKMDMFEAILAKRILPTGLQRCLTFIWIPHRAYFDFPTQTTNKFCV